MSSARPYLNRVMRLCGCSSRADALLTLAVMAVIAIEAALGGAWIARGWL